MTKTLYISVSDTFEVNDENRQTFELVKSEAVFVVFVSGMLERLFANVNNFCRPPTSVNFSSLIQKNHLAC